MTWPPTWPAWTRARRSRRPRCPAAPPWPPRWSASYAITGGSSTSAEVLGHLAGPLQRSRLARLDDPVPGPAQPGPLAVAAHDDHRRRGPRRPRVPEPAQRALVPGPLLAHAQHDQVGLAGLVHQGRAHVPLHRQRGGPHARLLVGARGPG